MQWLRTMNTRTKQGVGMGRFWRLWAGAMVCLALLGWHDGLGHFELPSIGNRILNPCPQDSVPNERAVTPEQTGVQKVFKGLDFGSCRHDECWSSGSLLFGAVTGDWHGSSGQGRCTCVSCILSLFLLAMWPWRINDKNDPYTARTSSGTEPLDPNALYRVAVGEMREGVAVVDTRTFHIEFANPALADILGMATSDELRGLSFLDFLSGPERERIVASLHQTRSRKKAPRRVYTACKKTGELIWLEVFICRESKADGDSRRWLLVSDVTSCKRSQEHNQYQARLLRDVDDAIIATDMDFHILSWNEAAERMYGWAASEVVGREVKDIVPVSVDGMTRGELRGKILDQGKWRGQAHHMTRNGRELTVDWSISTLFDAADKPVGIVAINRDITEHVRAKRELDEAHQRLLTILNGLDEAVCVVDIETHQVLFANRYAQEFFGAEMTGRPCWEVPREGCCELEGFCSHHPPKDGEAEDTGPHRFERQDSVRGEWWDVQVRTIDWMNGRVGRLEIATNITQRKAMEMELHARGQRYRELADLLPQPVFEIAMDGTISFANRSALSSFGYTEGELAGGLHLLEVIAPKDRERVEEAMRMASVTNQFEGGFELDVARKDGSLFPVAVYVNRIVQDGRLVGVRGILLDITDRKRTEAELLNMQRLESLAILAGGIAHDFNNLLMVIMGNISMAQMYAQPDEAVHRLLGDAENASIRAKDLAYKLLTFSKGGAPIKKVTALQGLIQDAASFALSGGNVKPKWDIAEDLWLTDCDPLQIHQVVSNLVMNAREAMPDGGLVRVAAHNVDAAREPGLSSKTGRYIKLGITDHGVGIAQEHIHHIYDPYFTTKPMGSEKGSGLGLSIVYSIVKKHEGFIVVDSKLNKGTAVIIHLPALAPGGETRTGKQPDARVSAKRILVMDDEETVRDVIAKLLAHLGYQAVLVSNGSDALAAYQESFAIGSPFAAVIMDLTIPGGMGGLETIRRLLALDPGAKAIISSGYCNDPVMQNYGAYGFQGVVAKPYKLQELRRALKKILGEVV
ncbi:MAG TPA: hypothetical protein DCE18_16885 [Syntrophobacteraceae bacterium]|nr:hypothetical protein [Syntrophobacteraceae bacterium]